MPVEQRPDRVSDLHNLWNAGDVRFAYRNPGPHTGGHFAFRTVLGHFRVGDFKVSELAARWRSPSTGPGVVGAFSGINL
ncbi:hypothetical protein OHA79_35800 [Streptomyces sp. NBC_00841]|uniref:hypothetical protein n=1 Tax=unclassified Streptomyces TaxID=2593676 RepID=UPI002257FB24|nr:MULTISPECIES: hypothetical protein [unclassified Streptomyces]MCX4531694.1 hypothetical protein [Streptomyces sp. NBC_01669]WSA02738.1 hypothetical protein OHA79_35800 [Streptomyces sp. NBC_00841]